MSQPPLEWWSLERAGRGPEADPYASAARIELMLMVEWMPEERPDWRDAVWMENVSAGPSVSGVATLTGYQEKYGACNVTTGNPRPLSWTEVGIYVRPDVLGSERNVLREYLSRE